MAPLDMRARILELKKEKDAVIFAHSYQPQEVQEVADVVADSLELARKAKESSAKTIVLCGVHFMAESACILAPNKKILLPRKDAGCPMANMISVEGLLEYKKRLPNAAVVTYVNSSADIKAISDVCCTSANALAVVRGIPEKEILFVPDKYLGGWIREQIGDEKIIHLYPGFCPVHQRFRETDIQRLKTEHPAAVTLCHPEAPPNIRQYADKVCSTSQMVKFATENEAQEFIILTETGIRYPLERKNPGKKFYFPDSNITCVNMKKTGLADVLSSLENDEHQITVPEEIRHKAFKALQRMLDYV